MKTIRPAKEDYSRTANDENRVEKKDTEMGAQHILLPIAIYLRQYPYTYRSYCHTFMLECSAWGRPLDQQKAFNAHQTSIMVNFVMSLACYLIQIVSQITEGCWLDLVRWCFGSVVVVSESLGGTGWGSNLTSWATSYTWERHSIYKTL